MVLRVKMWCTAKTGWCFTFSAVPDQIATVPLVLGECLTPLWRKCLVLYGSHAIAAFEAFSTARRSCDSPLLAPLFVSNAENCPDAPNAGVRHVAPLSTSPLPVPGRAQRVVSRLVSTQAVAQAAPLRYTEMCSFCLCIDDAVAEASPVLRRARLDGLERATLPFPERYVTAWRGAPEPDMSLEMLKSVLQVSYHALLAHNCIGSCCLHKPPT